MAADNAMFLQVNNDMFQALLVASKQQQYFNIREFQGMYTQQNTQQSELHKELNKVDQEVDQKYDGESDEEEVCQIFLA